MKKESIKVSLNIENQDIAEELMLEGIKKIIRARIEKLSSDEQEFLYQLLLSEVKDYEGDNIKK